MRYRIRHLLFTILAFSSITYASTLVQMRTDMGNIEIVLFEEIAPITVQNFLNYMNKGALGGYNGTYIHRSIAGFVVQGGGYIFDPADGDFTTGGISQIPQDPPIVNEANLPGALSNVRGTLAMAKQPGDPDSAKSEWFFNHVNNNDPSNPDNLDIQNGGFTIFGAASESGMTVVDQITLLPICYGLIGFLCDLIIPPSGFTPFINLDPTQPVQPENLVKINIVSTSVSGDSDGDGVNDILEDGAPGGDGNNDGTPDKQQAHVASLAGTRGEYLTFAVTEINGVPVAGAAAPARLDSTFVLGVGFPLATRAGVELAGFNFAHGFNGFNVVRATPAHNPVTSAIVEITLPAGQVPTNYFKYGPTPSDSVPHWHSFTYDGVTGAEFPGSNIIKLHFVDGDRGDSGIGAPDGEIRDPSASAIAFPAVNTLGGGGGGGGCSIQRSDTGFRQAGAWLLLGFLGIVVYWRNTSACRQARRCPRLSRPRS